MFLGISAVEFESSEAARDKIQKKLNELCGLQPDYTGDLDQDDENVLRLQQEQQEQQQEQNPKQTTIDFTLSSYFTSAILPSTGERCLKIAISETCIM